MLYKNTLISISLIFLIYVKANSQDGIIGKINYDDTIRGKIDSTTTFINANSKFAFAYDYDATMPEGLYGLYRADTVTGELRYALLYTYEKKIKKLTFYYFSNNKLIKVTGYMVPLKNQSSDKLDDYTRTYYYYNDSLYHFTNDTRENIDYKIDIKTSKDILKRFQNKYSTGKLVFVK